MAILMFVKSSRLINKANRAIFVFLHFFLTTAINLFNPQLLVHSPLLYIACYNTKSESATAIYITLVMTISMISESVLYKQEKSVTITHTYC